MDLSIDRRVKTSVRMVTRVKKKKVKTTTEVARTLRGTIMFSASINT